MAPIISQKQHARQKNLHPLVHWRLHRRLPEEHFLDTVTGAIRPVVNQLGPIVRTMARATRDPVLEPAGPDHIVACHRWRAA